MSDFKAVEQFLKDKGLDTENYSIQDTNGGYLPQIPLSLWLIEFAEQQANEANKQPDTKALALNIVSGCYSIDFDGNYKAILQVGDGALQVKTAVNGWGDAVTLSDITIEKL